jgi:hypothetical protein
MAASATELILIYNNANLTPFASSAPPFYPDAMLTARRRLARDSVLWPLFPLPVHASSARASKRAIAFAIGCPVASS